MSVGLVAIVLIASIVIIPHAHAALRDEIDILQEKIDDLYEDIQELEIDIQKANNDVKTYEISVSNLETRQKVAKERYDESPSDTTRENLQDITNDLVKAERDLNNAKAKLENYEDSLRAKNSQVITLEKNIANMRLLPNDTFKPKTDHEHYGIVLSKTCTTMISNNMSTVCPTYEELNALFPDTSNQQVSGKLEFINGMYQRGNDIKNGHWGFYNFHEKTTTWIDPPGDIRDKINLIIIEPRLPEYKIAGLQKMENNTIYVGHNRHVDSCRTATITATDWLFLTGDTMRYLQNDCDPEFTTFSYLKKHVFQKTEMDISTSYKWQLDNWLEKVKNECKGICKEY